MLLTLRAQEVAEDCCAYLRGLIHEGGTMPPAHLQAAIALLQCVAFIAPRKAAGALAIPTTGKWGELPGPTLRATRLAIENDGMTAEEVAEALELSATTVKNRLARARKVHRRAKKEHEKRKLPTDSAESVSG